MSTGSLEDAVMLDKFGACTHMKAQTEIHIDTHSEEQVIQMTSKGYMGQHGLVDV